FYSTGLCITEHYTLSLHDALPISPGLRFGQWPLLLGGRRPTPEGGGLERGADCGTGVMKKGTERTRRDGSAFVSSVLYVLFGKGDRKSTRLNSSHRTSSYAVFCMK